MGVPSPGGWDAEERGAQFGPLRPGFYRVRLDSGAGAGIVFSLAAGK